MYSDCDLTAVEIDYDREGDVLYLSFGPPQEAVCIDIGKGVLVRLNTTTRRVVGLTILDFRARYCS